MLTGLYLIAFTLSIFGNVVTDQPRTKKKDLGFYMFGIGFTSLFFITIGYGIHLIINS